MDLKAEQGAPSARLDRMLVDLWDASLSAGDRVVALRDIADSPMACPDCSARRGEVGEVQDVDSFRRWVIVDFGRGAILCDESELAGASNG